MLSSSRFSLVLCFWSYDKQHQLVIFQPTGVSKWHSPGRKKGHDKEFITEKLDYLLVTRNIVHSCSPQHTSTTNVIMVIKHYLRLLYYLEHIPK